MLRTNVKSHEHREWDHDASTRRQEVVPEAQTAPVERLAASIGNQAFGVLARDGGGILPDGTAHPDVTAAIARRRGYGEAIDDGLREEFSGKFGDSLHDVTFHKDAEAGEIARSVDANAFTTGADVYFAPGQFKPDSPEGKELIAHELAHVVQQRGAPKSGPMRVSMPGEPLERDAERAARGA
jgi:hypothetical protein